MSDNLSEIDVVILCGGQGTRLRPVVSDRPKALAKIGEKTFLDILIDDLRRSGFKNIILCIGYLKKAIKDHIINKNDYNISFSEEDVPLGTGGALKKAEPMIKSSPFIVMNGDSICKINFHDFYNFHLDKMATLSMALVQTTSSQDFGSVVLDESNRIVSYREKEANLGEPLINAGVYLMEREIFSLMPDQDRFSMEYDFFPQLAGGRLFGFAVDGELMDIGTPERYKKANYLIRGGNESKIW